MREFWKAKNPLPPMRELRKAVNTLPPTVQVPLWGALITAGMAISVVIWAGLDGPNPLGLSGSLLIGALGVVSTTLAIITGVMELVEAFPRQHLETNVTLQFEEQMGRYILILHFENTGAFISAFFVGLELLDDFEPIWNQDFPGPGAYGRPLVSGERDAIPAVLTDDLMGRIDSLRYVATWSTDRIRDKKSFGGLVKNMRGYRGAR
ncbi:MAG: hypothetical protein O2812_04260 [Chloroflexi bacterium]|nr:hypothetical protein [Chloroflexota bacterium]